MRLEVDAVAAAPPERDRCDNGPELADARRTPMTAKTVWYFYKVKWGAQDEFLALFRKNHYPVLTAQLGGRLAAIRPLVPATTATDGPTGRSSWS